MIDALITVIKGGKVVYKIICRCNGRLAYLLANKILHGDAMDEMQAFTLAHSLGIGCTQCLEVYTVNYSIRNGLTAEHSNPEYTNGFENPRHFPHPGNVDYIHVVDLDKSEVNGREKGQGETDVNK